MKKLFTLALLAIAFIATSAFGQQTKDFDVTLNTMYRSSYLGVNDNMCHNGPVAQTDIFILHKSGFYLDLWNSCAFDNFKSYGDEQDVGIGWMGKVYGFSINTEVFYFKLYPFNQTKGDIIELMLEINRIFEVGKSMSITPYVRGEYVVFLPTTNLKNAPDVRFGLRSSWSPVKQVTLSNDAHLVYDYGIGCNDKALLFKDCVSATVHVTRQFDVIGEFTFFTPGGKPLSDGRKTETVLGLGCAYHF